MQPATVRDLRLLLIAAAIGLIGGCVFFGSRETPDEELVRLVGRLTASLTGSTVLASSIVTAAAIIAAVLIPAVTVFCVLRFSTSASLQQPEDETRSSAAQITAHLPRALPAATHPDKAIEAVTDNKVEQRSTIGVSGDDATKGTP